MSNSRKKREAIKTATKYQVGLVKRFKAKLNTQTTKNNFMTNREHWQRWCSGLSSPQSYIDWGWIYTVSAALQRRVWLSSSTQQVFPNMYVIFVGEPGVGKGLVIARVNNILKNWSLKDAINLEQAKLTKEQKLTVETIQEDDLENASKHEMQQSAKGTPIIPPALIPVAADATTYEALVKAVADSFRRINYVKEDGSLGFGMHSSICFCLQELSSLMRKRTDDTVNFLLGLYDCPKDYEYVTKTQGKDRVRSGCINILAGTTPTFMQSTFDEKLMGEGFSSRTFYIFAAKNRKHQFFIPDELKEQEESRKVIVEHIRKLTSLYGKVTVTRETCEWLENWWTKIENEKGKRPNKSLKLVPYYARKNIHVMKVAMAIHFSESLEMTISLETFQKAIKILDEEEKNMHFAITIEAKNPLAGLSKKVLELLGVNERDFVTLHSQTWDLGGMKDLEESLEFLHTTGQITQELKQNSTTTVMWYKLKKS